MDPRHGPGADAFRIRIRRLIAENLPDAWHGIGAIATREEADAFVEGWRRILAGNGLLGVSWPKEYGGGGFTKLEQVVLVEELARVGVPTMGYNDTFGIKMLGGTLLVWGTEEQKRYFLPRIISGDDRWCQGFSEPGSGSDLASLSTRAVLDGDSWMINGQKLWTSRALEANRMFLLARTNPAASKNRGISFLLLDLEQPGVEIRPVRQLSGDSEFNEVFFDRATTPADHIVGEVDGGWAVASTLLGLERGEEAATNPILFRAELDRLLQMASDRGRSSDPVVRDRLASAYVRCEVMRFLGLRILTAVLNNGRLGAEASISKLYWSEYHRDVTRLALDVLGPEALQMEGRLPLRAFRTDDPGAPNTTGSWLGAFYNGVADTIYAGTSEVQRNILGETVLGLPREPRPVS
ncbi:MAG TPA: acyl-CoA dehydrogenase family protein [Acidimicrobiales bacterium]|nr:acyl-CoA dehydrogenase family protein [Acidimicrobiales bacterium]